MRSVAATCQTRCLRNRAVRNEGEVRAKGLRFRAVRGDGLEAVAKVRGSLGCGFGAFEYPDGGGDHDGKRDEPAYAEVVQEH